MEPKISVIIPCYNQGQYIDEAVKSVLGQTFKDFEIIIVNDGSTDDATNTLLKDYVRPKTKIIWSKNLGVSGARNLGIKEALGKYILALDADDMIKSTYFKKTISILEKNPKCALVSPYVQTFGEERYLWKTKELNLVEILCENNICTGSIFRKKCWEQVDGFDEKIGQDFEDWDFWIRIAEWGWQGKVIEKPLFFYRIKKNSVNRQNAVKKRRLENYARLINKHRKYFKKYADEIALAKESVIIDYRNASNRQQRKIKSVEQDYKEEFNQLENIYRSYSWKILAPVRLPDKIIKMIKRKK